MGQPRLRSVAARDPPIPEAEQGADVFKRFVIYAEIDDPHADDFRTIMALIDDAVVHRNWGTLDIVEADPDDADIAWAIVVDNKEPDSRRRREYARQLAALASARHVLEATNPGSDGD